MSFPSPVELAPLEVPAAEFTADERKKLAPFFTNVDRPIFGLKLPQEVAGALFSRYSRTAKSLRRVFLDEFLGAGVFEGAEGAEGDSDAALRKAREFYDRVLIGYGDDSVAQLGGAHVACERISNVAAKLLEDGRIGISYLEKSTRYVRFDQRDAAGEYLFHKEPRIMASRHREAYLGLMNRLFATYARQIDPLIAFLKQSLPIEKVAVRHPKTGEPVSFEEVESSPDLRASAERAYNQTVRAHACDVMRSYLPGATLTNVGVFASGQAYELLLTKLSSQDLTEGRELSDSMRRDLEGLIPSFVKRARRSEYLVEVASGTRKIARKLTPLSAPIAQAASVTLIDHDEQAEEKILAALLYPASRQPLAQLREIVGQMTASERRARLEEFAVWRRNRRDKPGRALESVAYTFDVLANFGCYRDLQRHRMLSQERQEFTTAHGYDTPPELDEAGFGAEFRSCMAQAHDLYEALMPELPLESQYVVPFAYRVRWYLRMNLREAVHLCELRSMPQGHADYRVIAQSIWHQIEEVHPALSGWARYLSRENPRLGRLQSEFRTEFKRGLLADK